MAETKSRFGALKTFRQQGTGPEPVPAEASPAALEPAGKGRGRPLGKRSNPEYEPTTVLLRKKTKKAAIRLLEDRDAGQDLSDLIESLLGEWTSEHS